MKRNIFNARNGNMSRLKPSRALQYFKEPADFTLSLPWHILDLVNYIIYYLTIMITINIHEAKTHLSHYLDEVEKGERIVVCKRNRPVAEIRQILPKMMEKRPIGLAKGTFTVPASFFDELPDETIALFSGETS